MNTQTEHLKAVELLCRLDAGLDRAASTGDTSATIAASLAVNEVHPLAMTNVAWVLAGMVAAEVGTTIPEVLAAVAAVLPAEDGPWL